MILDTAKPIAHADMMQATRDLQDTYCVTPAEHDEAQPLLERLIAVAQEHIAAGDDPRRILVAEYALRCGALAVICGRTSAGLMPPDEAGLFADITNYVQTHGGMPLCSFAIDLPHLVAVMAHLDAALRDPRSTGRLSTLARTFQQMLAAELQRVAPSIAENVRRSAEEGANA